MLITVRDPLTAFCRYVPNPSPSVFRTTKNNHNILQGVADPSLRLTKEAKDNFDAWILKNGLRWTAEGGPLAPGGVDIAFIGQFSLSHARCMLTLLGAPRRRPADAGAYSAHQARPP